jgi:hypothetical protein
MITLTSPVTLTEGAYWVSVQAREDFANSGQWVWDNRSVISNSVGPGKTRAAASGCLTWGGKRNEKPLPT